ncbi:MAG: dihydroorotase [Spirochaeta sp.]
MMKRTGEMVLRRPDDMHLHVRQGEIMKVVVPETARVFARAIIMPNTIPPVTTADRVERYYQKIKAAAGSSDAGRGFEPLMTFKILPGMQPDDVHGLKHAGVLAGKLYPEGATTNAEDGVHEIADIYPVLEVMQDLELVLCIHGEDPAVFSLDREEAFLPTLARLSSDFPRLRIVMEHLSTAAAVEAVNQLPNVCGTITLHHLELTLDDLLGGELKPHLFCKPIVKRPSDQAAIRRAAVSGNPKYFFGSDSAPHSILRKQGDSARAGVFSAPVAFEGLLRFFDQQNAMNRLEDFTSRFGAEFYGLPLNRDSVVVQRREWIAPEEISGLLPYHAGSSFPFHVSVV